MSAILRRLLHLLPAVPWRALLRSRVARGLGLLVLVAGALFAGLRATAAISVGSTSGTWGNSSQFTHSHTVASGTDRVLIVGVAQENPSSNRVRSVTYNGVALTRIAPSWASNNNNEVSLWLMVAPPVGTANVVVQIRDSGGSLRSEKAVVRAVNFTGVDQSDSIRISAGDMGISNSITVTVPSVTNDVVFGVVATTGDAGAITPTVGTELWEQTTGTGGGDVRSEGVWAAGAGSVTMTWTTAASKNYTVQAVSLRPSGAGIASGAGIVIRSFTTPAAVDASSLTFSHAVPAGNNRALVVTVGNDDQNKTVNSVTYGGVALTKAADRPSADSRATLWYLLAPAVGTANVVVSLSGIDNLAAMALNLSGVNQTTPIGTAATATATSSAPSATVTSAAGEWVVGVLATKGDANNASANVGQTSLYNTNTGTASGDIRFVTDIKPGAASTAMGWTLASSKSWAAVAVPFKPTPAHTISGTVFEDINYGGGAGRSQAAAGGVGIAGARVELYDSTGSLVSATTTAAGGGYSFSVNGQSTYYVRVVTGSVLSTRTGSSASLIGVQTYRTNASTGAAVGVTNAVGGTNPSAGSAPAADTGGTFDTSTFVYNAGISGTAQSVTTVAVASANISGLDVGFNFDTVVNTLDSGYGSLRQAITNANTLGGDASLAVAGRSAGIEHVLFNIGTTATGFTGSVGTNGRAVMTLASNLPAITAPLVVDGGTQTTSIGNSNPGLVGAGGTVGADALALSQVARPEVELIGNASMTAALTIAAANVTVRGLAIHGVRGAAGAGIVVNSGTSATLIEGNLIGVNAVGVDPGAGLRSLYGVVANGGSGVTVQNNYIAYTDTAALATLSGLSTGWTLQNNEVREIGLADVAADGINMQLSSGWTVLGNLIVNVSTQAVLLSTQAAAGDLVINNTITGAGRGSSGAAPTQVDAVGARSGATSARLEANIVTGNYGPGIMVSNGASGVAITRNLIHGNGTVTSRTGQAASGSIDIDLLNTTDNNLLGTAPFFTINDTGDPDSGGNGLQNHPVLTRATVLTGQLEVQGTLNTNASGYYRIEFFSSSTPHSTARGGGQVYLGFVNVATDGSGNASFTATLNVSVTTGTSISATAIKSNVAYAVMSDTSEYAPNVLATLRVSGTVFEDPNYGGGAGRTMASANGVGLNGARVELYSSAGAFVSFTTTAGGGAYGFDGVSASTGYFVRVVSSTLASQRSGSIAGLLGVMTYRAATTGAAGTLSDVTDWVGGTNPASADPGSGAGGTSFNTSTYVFTAGLTGTAHAVSPVTTGSVSLGSVNLGFNFSTVTNTNDSDQGSLRQFLTNTAAFTDQTSLAQSGNRTNAGVTQALPAGFDTTIFMIPRGVAVAGIRAAAANQLTAGVAAITTVTTLPTVVRANVVLDGSTQTANVGNSNAAVLGTGGTVGVDALALAQVQGPEVQIAGGTGLIEGLQWNAANGRLRGVAMYGYGTRVLNLSASATGMLVEQNVLGTTATVFADPGTGRSAGHLLQFTGLAANVTISNNLVGWSGLSGLIGSTGSGVTVSGNELRNNAVGNAAHDGINSFDGANCTINGNLITATRGVGIDNAGGAGTGQSYTNNTLSNNGTGGSKIVGARLGSGQGVFSKNIVSGHPGSGLTIMLSNSRLQVTQNAFSGNNTNAVAGRAAGISLNGGTTGANVTANDGAKTAGQPNQLMDHPVFTAASLNGTTLTVAGYVGSAAGQSTFASATVEVFVSSNNSSGFGEGQVYLGALAANASGNFTGSIDVTGKGVTNGSTRLTGTATDASGNTSEFGANASVGFALSGTVFEDANYGGGAGRTLAAASGSGASGATVELYSNSGVFVSSSTAASGGTYSFSGLTAGNYFVRVVSSTVLSQRSGSTGALVGVLTYRTTAASGSALAVTDHVGGTNPALVDPAAGSSGATFNTSTFVYSAGLSGTAQNVAPVTLGSSSISALDFGFNFDTVVNTNTTGQGSLRQAMTNADTLGGDASLAVAGRTAATEHLVFIISNGSSAAGLRSMLNYFTGGIATIAPTAALPTLANPLVIDAQLQPGWTAAPVIELNGAGAGAAVTGLTLNGNGSSVRGLVINRFLGNGITTASATGLVIEGNYIGTNAAGGAASANTLNGILIAGGSATIGGLTASTRNVISGNTLNGVSVSGGSATVRGNSLGANAAASGAIANGASGVLVASSNNTIGGTAAGAGNLIRGNGARGVSIANGAFTGNAVLGNSIFGNTGLGIDLKADGLTAANDGAKTAGTSNLSMDSPVFTSASISGTTLSVAGYVGSAAGQSTFATSRVEVFVSDASSSAGQGQTYLGTLTTDASGNFSGTLSSVTGVTNGSTQITGTATDASNNTSEFGTNAPLGWAISGTVFEDVNYGGGAGRTLAASSGVGLAGATVELYNGSGVWVSATTTASGGSYGFTGLAAATYHVRVVGSTVLSQRSGSTGALVGVMTYRTTASSGTAVAVADQVGGTTPSQVDPAAGSAGATFNTFTGVYSAVLTGTAQAFSPVVVSTGAIGGVDFGFNFDTVVNINPGGQGSLRQAITNANALGNDAALAVAGRTAGVEHVVFMLADGSTRPGLRNTFPSQFAAGIAIITPGSVLPTVNAALVLDAQTQPGWVQDPIVELRGTSAGAVAGLTLSAGASTVRGLIVNRYGSHGISVTGGAGHTVQGCWVGADATGAAAAANTGAGISVSTTAVGLQIGGTTAAQRNVLSGNTSHGLNVDGGSAVVVQGNYVGTNASGTAAVANGGRGVFLGAAVTAATLGGTAAGAGNVISGNADTGAWLDGGAATVQGNTIGLNAAGTTALANAHGLRVNSSGHLVGGTTTAARNVIAGNTGRGIWLSAGGNTVQGNYVGTNAAGTLARPNSDGIYAAGINNTIGGAAAGAGNLVSGNSAAGVLLDAAANGSVVQGNVVGLNAALAAALPNNIGISVACSSGCSIGGTASGEGNTISGNSTTAVTVSAGSQGNAILRNSIYGNGGIGIDLNANGVSANDGAKTGGAGNQLMDHPVFTSARARGNQFTVAGYVGTAAGQALFANARVEIYTSDQDASGFGEGQTYLGVVTTDASGNFSATITMTASVLPVGTRLTGTATDAGNNTSEFGANFAGLVVDLVVNHNGDGVDANPGDGICQTATAGQCTLRAALQELNALAVQPGALTIAFALPGCSAGTEAACVISPATNLPTAVKAVVVDGSTQTGYSTRPLVALAGPGSGTPTALEVGAGAGGSTVRALRFAGWTSGSGTTLNLTGSSGHTVQGNWFGLDASGVATAGAANRYGVSVHGGSSSSVIGGTTTLQRNIVAGSSAAGIYLLTGSGNQVLGNWFGLNADGSSNAQSPNNIGLSVRSAAALVGGVLAGEGNRFGPATLNHIAVDTNAGAVPTSSATIRGNLLGLNGAGAVVASGGDAVFVDTGVSSTTIGGTAAGSGNTITGAAGRGIGVVNGSSTRVTIQGNSLYGNTVLGIDLGRNGVTANDGATNASLANNGIDHPVITGGGVSAAGTSLTVSGVIGTGSGQAAFAGARVEIFKAAPHATGYGEGQVYLGALTADASGGFSGVLSVAAGSINGGEAITATATDAAGNTSEFGPNWTTATAPGLLPSKFNVFETSTAAGALTGVIKTKTVGMATTLDVIAIDSSGTAVSTAFTGSVSLTWLDARDNSGSATADGCRSSWVAGAAAGSLTFTGGLARQGVALTPPAVGREWRLRMTHTPASGAPVVSCSGDNFAVRPSALQITAVGDSSDSAAASGTPARSLMGASASQTSGGAVHRAGRAFSLRANAVNSSNVLQAGYDGTATLVQGSCALPATGCVAGVLTVGTLAVSGGVVSSDTLQYSEVGSVNLQLSDTSFADVDLADSSLAERRIDSSTVTVGRFVPDNYTAALTAAGVYATANAACTASGAGYTFTGQAFTWGTTPVVQLTARNADGSITRNWTGGLMKLVAASHVQTTFSMANAGGATLSSALGPLSLVDSGSGLATLTRSSADSFVVSRNNSTPVASTTPTLAATTTVTDTAEAGVTGNGSTTVAMTQNAIGFTAGGVFHHGRLQLNSGHGDARVGVRVLAELQRFTASGWQRMSEDNGCITVQPAALALESPRGRFTGGGLCAAPLPAAAVPTRGGRAWMVLPPSPNALPGALLLRVNLGTASGTACTAAGVPQAAASMNLTHLRGSFGGAATQDQDPRANVTWGRPNRELLLRRERFD